jgi:hypothetical protein
MSETKPQTTPLAGLHRRLPWYRRLAADVLYVARRDRKWWLLPLIILLLALAGLLTMASVAGPLAPFIYPFL